MREAGGLDPKRVKDVWPALCHRQRELKGDMAVFETANVRDLKQSIARAAGPPLDPSQAVPPGADQIDGLWRIVRGRVRVPGDLRGVAFLALLQFYSVQRSQAVVGITQAKVRASAGQCVTLMHKHKTQPKASRGEPKPDVPTEPFPDPGLRTVMSAGIKEGWLQGQGSLVTKENGKKMSYNRYNEGIKEIWVIVGVEEELAGSMNSHGLRRGGFQYYYDRWGMDGLDKILRMGHWKSLSSAKPYLPPSLKHLV